MKFSHWFQQSFSSGYEQLCSMQVAKKRFMKKCATLSSVAKKETSCSRGWLRLVVQSIFAVITTASFILIVMMAVKNPAPSGPKEPPRSKCRGCNCRVVCNEAPYLH